MAGSSQDGTYCFLFEKESKVREKYYREQEHIYRKSDAGYHIEVFCDADLTEVPVDACDMLNERIEDIIYIYDKTQDCDTDENSTWDTAVEMVYNQIFNDMFAKFASKTLKSAWGDNASARRIPYNVWLSQKSDDDYDFSDYIGGKWYTYLDAHRELTNDKMTFEEHIKFFDWLAKNRN